MVKNITKHFTKKTMLILASATMLSACNSLEELKEIDPRGNSFNSSLAKEYLAYAESEKDQLDWMDSDYFADKGLQAAQGENVLPEDPHDWNVPEESLAKLEGGRNRLINHLNASNKQRKSAKLARAQLLYDCWVEQEEEEWQDEHIATCEDGFYDALANLEGRKVAKHGDTGAKTLKSVAHSDNDFSIYFALDSDKINNSGKNVITRISKYLSGYEDYRLDVEGHADRSGGDDYNYDLSLRRANAVADMFKKMGTNVRQVMVNAYGENRPKVPTADGVVEQQNRRVDIKISEF